MLRADIITIGDEILIGQIVDTNSAWMAARLDDAGVQVRQIRSIADTQGAILEALEQPGKPADIVLLTGGLGPTRDDVTKTTLAGYFNCGMRLDEEVLEHVTGIFARTGRAMPPVNRKQAEVLDRAEVLFNATGTAPGMYVQDRGRHFFIMPGVPVEMQYIMETHVLPRITTMQGRMANYHRSLLTAGLGESFLAEQIADIEAELPQHWHLAYLPAFGQVRLRLSASGPDRAMLAKQAGEYIEQLKTRLDAYWISDDGSSLPQAIIRALISRQKTLSTAESCTGGRLAGMITEVPGCSAVFQGGVVAYSNELKKQLLSVPGCTLAEKGAVSRETVTAMAEGARKHLGTDYALATSGIAGPGGGSPDKPVGTVWIAVAGPEGTQAQRLQLGTFRQTNIERASIQALILLKSILFKEKADFEELKSDNRG